jgi:hypothetical protein
MFTDVFDEIYVTGIFLLFYTTYIKLRMHRQVSLHAHLEQKRYSKYFAHAKANRGRIR